MQIGSISAEQRLSAGRGRGCFPQRQAPTLLRRVTQGRAVRGRVQASKPLGIKIVDGPRVGEVPEHSQLGKVLFCTVPFLTHS